MSKNELIVRAEQIRDEILPDGNTAPRVGSLLIDIIESTGGSGSVSSILFNRQTLHIPDSNGVISLEAFPINAHLESSPFLVASKGSIVRILFIGQSAGTYTDYVCIKDYNDTPGGSTGDSGGYGNTEFFMPWLEFVDRVKNSVGSLKIDGLELFPTPNTTQIAFSIDSKIGTRINFWVSELPNAEEAETGKKYYSEQDKHLWVVSTNGGAHWVDRGAVRSGVIYLFENEAGDDLKYICDEDSGSLYPLMFLTSMINKIEKVSVDGEELAIDIAKGVNVTVDTKIGLPVNIVSTMTGLSGITTGEFYYALDTNHIHIQPSGYAPVLDRGLADKGIIYISKPDRNKYKFDGNRLFLIGENLVQDASAQNVTAHPHWFYDANPIQPSSDTFNLNLVPSGQVSGKLGYPDAPIGSFGMFLWASDLRRVIGIWNNQFYTSGSALPRSCLGVRGVRPCTELELKYPDGTIFEKVYRDFDGNWYSGAKIGTQMWHRENLKTTRLQDGTPIPLIDYSSLATTTGNEPLFGRIVNPIVNATPQPSTLTSDAQAVEFYGYAYSGQVASDYRLIDKDGWKVCSYSEWEAMKSYIATTYPTINLLNSIKSARVVGATYKDPNQIEPVDGKKIDARHIANLPVINMDTMASKSFQVSGVCLAADWYDVGNGFAGAIYNTNIKEHHFVDVIPTDQEQAVSGARIKPYVDVQTGTVLLYADYKPAVDFNVNLIIRE